MGRNVESGLQSLLRGLLRRGQRRAVIRLDPTYHTGSVFEIIARNNSKRNVYVQSARLNGKPLAQPRIRYADIAGGGRLELEMGPDKAPSAYR